MVAGLPLSFKLSPGKWLTDSPEKVRGSLYQLLLSPGFATSRRERGCTALPPPGWVRACPADEVNGTLGSREPQEVEGEWLFRTSQAAASDSTMTSGVADGSRLASVPVVSGFLCLMQLVLSLLFLEGLLLLGS